MKKKDLTEAQIKDQLFQAACNNVGAAYIYLDEPLVRAIEKYMRNTKVHIGKVGDVSLADANKIKAEVKESCLSPKTKKAILAAIGK